MKVRPLNDRLLVSREEKNTRTKGGIIIPDTAKEKSIQGKVVACGPGALDKKGTRRSLDVKKGDGILFSKYAGTEIQIDGREYLVMKEDDVLGIIE